MDSELFNKIGKYVVWFVVLIAIGYTAGAVFQVVLFVLPGVLLLFAVYYVLKNMKDQGVVMTLKGVMQEPLGYIKTLFFTVFKGLKQDQE